MTYIVFPRVIMLEVRVLKSIERCELWMKDALRNYSKLQQLVPDHPLLLWKHHDTSLMDICGSLQQQNHVCWYFNFDSWWDTKLIVPMPGNLEKS